MLLLLTLIALIHTTIHSHVNTPSHQTMCFSKSLVGRPPMAKLPEEFKLSTDFESNCDYVEIESRHELASEAKSLALIQLNIRGLLSKTTLLKELLSTNLGKIRPDAILLCETWLNTTNFDSVTIPNYKLMGNVRHGKLGGGTGILVHKSLKCRERKDLELKSTTFEHTVVEL